MQHKKLSTVSKLIINKFAEWVPHYWKRVSFSIRMHKKPSKCHSASYRFRTSSHSWYLVEVISFVNTGWRCNDTVTAIGLCSSARCSINGFLPRECYFIHAGWGHNGKLITPLMHLSSSWIASCGSVRQCIALALSQLFLQV